jgi:hypothetical protein
MTSGSGMCPTVPVGGDRLSAGSRLPVADRESYRLPSAAGIRASEAWTAIGELWLVFVLEAGVHPVNRSCAQFERGGRNLDIARASAQGPCRQRAPKDLSVCRQGRADALGRRGSRAPIVTWPVRPGGSRSWVVEQTPRPSVCDSDQPGSAEVRMDGPRVIVGGAVWGVDRCRVDAQGRYGGEGPHYVVALYCFGRVSWLFTMFRRSRSVRPTSSCTTGYIGWWIRRCRPPVCPWRGPRC